MTTDNLQASISFGMPLKVLSDQPFTATMHITPTATPQLPEKPPTPAVSAKAGPTAAQEVAETPAQTAKEAAAGDQQAQRLQASRAQKTENQNPPPGTAKLVKVTA